VFSRHSIPIGRVFGISIDLDYSWFLIFGLLTWMMAVSYYPHEFKNWSPGEYWLIGAITAVMLFVSVLLHELGHSVVAIRYGISVPRITLFIFGGVSQIATEPPNAAAEFWIAIAGPSVSFLLALIFWGLQHALAAEPPLFALTKYLALLNFILGLFNLIPGFPLDGGRVFRAIVWGVGKNFRRATTVAAITGRLFGFLFIFLGIAQVLGGNTLNGVWIAFIGWFLESAAGSQIREQVIKGLLLGHKVSEVMNRDYAEIPADMSLQELVDKYVLAGGRRTFVVNRAGEHPGLVTLAQIKSVPRTDWATTHATDVMIPPEKLLSIQPSTDAWNALEKMGRDGVNQLPVVDTRGIVGMLSRDDLLHYLQALQTVNA
jgi:Zn-dependent protease